VPGYYGSKGSPCLECASGSYSAVNGSSICLSCPTGLYIVWFLYNVLYFTHHILVCLLKTQDDPIIKMRSKDINQFYNSYHKPSTLTNSRHVLLFGFIGSFWSIKWFFNH
jgi:hypothetical protein